MGMKNWSKQGSYQCHLTVINPVLVLGHKKSARLLQDIKKDKVWEKSEVLYVSMALNRFYAF